MLRKLERAGHISMLTFPGRHGTAIYLQNYLSTMFQISDVKVDKDEVAMSLRIKVSAPDYEDQPIYCGSNEEIIVSKTHREIIARKVLQLLAAQGVGCAECPRMTYKLYPLSDDGKGMYERDTLVRRFRMDILCSGETAVYTFELSTTSNTV